MLTLVLGTMPGAARARAAALGLTGEDLAVAAAGHLFVLRDADGRMTLDDVMAARETFQPIPGTFNAGYSPQGAWWLRLTVQPDQGGGGPWLLELTAPYTDTLDVYAPLAGEAAPRPLVHRRTGWLVPLAERDLFSHLYVVRTDLAAATPQDIYIRVSGTRALTLAPTLWRESPFLSHLTANALMIAFIVGAACITALGSVIFGLWLRASAFVWYGAYLSFAALVVLGNSGLATFLLSPLSPTLVLRLQGMIGCTTIMSGAFMVRAIFCAKGQHPVIARIFAGIGLAAGVFVGAAAFGYYSAIAPVLMAGLLLLCVLLPWLAIMRVKRREPAAGWYCFGFSAYSLSGIWFCLMVLGIVPMSTVGERGTQISSLLTMVAVFVGLATSVRAGARERRGLQEKLLQASQQNERELEQAVAQRTQALETEIAARRAAEAALVEAMREQRHFLVIVSHEFRTPLASIRVAIAIIERRLGEADAMARREAARIIRTVGRLSQMIDTFLAEEVLDKTSVQLRRAPVELSALVQDICHEHATQTARDIRFEAGAAPPIEADFDLLRTAIENLVNNAIRYTEGQVRVAVQPDTDGVTVAVEDDGPGIPEDERLLIFERYYRASSSRSHAGIGIGLSIVRKIVTLHGGEAAVTGTPDGGSRFSIWLPYVAKRPSEAQV
ncbi:sensor histidine kinase [Azorhizobium sp. AG788]|uniref:sensor histidine kinase n=1 Tax=Azorhizobium sp. AG788 TaxID=2183897 RepID=UPI0031387B5B